MRIGIDAKWFYNGNPSGKVVVRNILEEFLKIAGGHKIYIFLNKEEEKLIFPFVYPNVTLVYVWGKNNQLSNLIFVRREVNKLQLDAVLYFGFPPLFTTGKRIVFIFDAIYSSNPEYFSLTERLYFSTVKYLASKSDKILTISKTEKNRLLKYEFNLEKNIDVVFLGVNYKFKPREYHPKEDIARVRVKYGLPDTYLLYVGRINARKNLRGLFSALSNLKDKEVKLVVAGIKDRKSDNLQKIIQNIGIEGRVVSPGYIDDNDLPVLYSLAKIFCYVSYDEGFGLPPVEAMASGIPVVVSETGSLPEICGNAGSYCNPFNANNIAEKIDLLLSDEKYYNEKRQRGFEAAKKYKWSKTARQLLDVFNEAAL